MTEQFSEAGFNKRRTVQDPWVASLLEKHELASDASLEEIEPKAKELWEDMTTRLDSVEMVLGRRVDGSEPSQNPDLGSVMLTADTSEAFGGLLMLKTLEELQAER